MSIAALGPAPRHLRNDAEGEGNGRTEGYSRPRIVTAHDRRHVVAASVETRNRGTVAIEHSTVAIRSQPGAGAEIGRMNRDGKEGCLLDLA